MIPAIGLMLISINLLIYKNQKTLGNLVLLGYQRFKLALPYCLLALILNVIIGLASLLIAVYAQKMYSKQLLIIGITETSGFWLTAVFAIIFVLLVTALNSIWIWRNIKKIKIPARG